MTTMNRRGFFKRLLLGGAAFTILPGAGRIWKAQRQTPAPILREFWFETNRLATCESEECRRFIEALLYGKPLSPDCPANRFSNLPTIVTETTPYQNHIRKLMDVLSV